MFNVPRRSEAAADASLLVGLLMGLGPGARTDSVAWLGTGPGGGKRFTETSGCGSAAGGVGGLAGSGAQVTELVFITFFLDWDLVLFKLEEERSTGVLLKGSKGFSACLVLVAGAGSLGGLQAVGRKNNLSLLVVMLLLVPPLHKASLTSLHHEAKEASASPVRGP